ncbi:MAG: HlyD family efflux transporter periplasmic adaptor subunit [Candidatus Krumholzibacteria bacterium]|nr:HlyD family efflux transporter periplasmic adaptor subunit [Candidatus Krumholzibacteria bacterium]MDP6669436.1 HlyD family efflux transporter periplasmic adaptor subunit [Candidatus Krumholzibacteria bacterium]MDP7021955.1 HlyD family efflux transporter periplasmic adaptor subunit [Candidatus Krumholzibacteria bacterium]
MTRVPESWRRGRFWSVFLGSLAVLFLVLGLVKVDRRVSGSCQLLPRSQWTLSELGPGSYESRAVDHQSGETLHYRVYRFDRPAILDLELSDIPDNPGHRRVNEGDLIARVQSSSLELEMAERARALGDAKSLLATLKAGEKPEELDRASLAQKQAQASYDAFLPQLLRQREMHREGIVSDEILEDFEVRGKLLSLDLDLARAELRVLSTGSRPEEIAAAEQTLQGLQAEMSAMEEVLLAQEILSPLGGLLHSGHGEGQLLQVSRQDSLVLTVLIPQERADFLKHGQQISFHVPGMKGTRLQCRLHRSDSRTIVTRSGNYIAVFASLENPGEELLPGMRGLASVYGERASLLRILYENFLRGLKREFWHLMGEGT